MKYSPIIRLWVGVNYKPDLNHFNNMFLAAKEVSNSFEHWWTDKINIVLHDYTKKESITITSKRLSCETIQPDNIKEKIDTFSGYIKAITQKLNHEEVARFGLKVTAYMNLGLKFDEIKERLRPMCLPSHGKLEALTSSTILDVSLNYDYGIEDKKVMLRIGPMKKKQGIDILNTTGDFTKLFPLNKESEIHKIYSSVPDEFMFFDLDIFKEDESKISDLDTFVNDAWNHIERVHKGMIDIILEL